MLRFTVTLEGEGQVGLKIYADLREGIPLPVALKRILQERFSTQDGICVEEVSVISNTDEPTTHDQDVLPYGADVATTEGTCMV